jgi:hypothetical protein
MLICEIFRNTCYGTIQRYTLSYTFPSGTGFVTINLIWSDEYTEVRTFELDPRKSTKVLMPL